MSDWGYVTLAYTIVWGGLALYALALARRVFQANALEGQLRALTAAETGEDAACDDDGLPSE